MPRERLRALQWAGELLTEIGHDEAIPEAVRRQAHVTLRHYPTSWQLAAASSSPMQLRSWIARDPLTEVVGQPDSTKEAAGEKQLSARLLTAWFDAGATGEGRTLMAHIEHAEGPAECRAAFERAFGESYASGCEISEGVVRNKITQLLFAEAALLELERLEGRPTARATAQLHINRA